MLQTQNYVHMWPKAAAAQKALQEELRGRRSSYRVYEWQNSEVTHSEVRR